MSDGDSKGPKPQLRRSDPRQCPEMTALDKPVDAKPDNKKAGADLKLTLPFDQRDQYREGKQHKQHRQQMAGG